jgi:type IV secretion system protein VirB5
MFSKIVLGLVLLGLLAFGTPRPAHAQFAVIDVASLTQLIQEYGTLQQELSTAQSQLAQAQSAYAAITGNRGMQSLLFGTNRNYLPTNWSQLSAVTNGSSGAYAPLSAQVQSLVRANAVLSPAQVAALSANQQVQLTSARESTALQQATARTALANSSDRFGALQQLISAIGTANDEKASLDLSARSSAELGMLQNEHTKLVALSEVERADDRARAQQLLERGIADQGSLRRLPPMGL